MSDGDEKEVIDLNHTRKSMNRTTARMTKQYNKYRLMREAKDSPATYDVYKLEEGRKTMEKLGKEFQKKHDILSREETDEAKVHEDERVYEEVQECVVDTLADIKMLLAMKSLHRAVSSLDVAINVLNQVFRESPMGDYAASVTAIQEKVAKLASELDKASLEDDDDELITRAKAVQERIGVTLGQVSEKVRALTTPDIKPIIKDGSRSGFKLPTITVPKFSGALEDWQSFWSAFERSIHQTEEFSKAAKLHYLREAMQDKALYRRLSPIDQPDDFYDEAVAELKKSFDKPRQMHLKYVMNIFNLGQVQPTKSSLNKCADILRDSMDGIDKSKQAFVRGGCAHTHAQSLFWWLNRVIHFLYA